MHRECRQSLLNPEEELSKEAILGRMGVEEERRGQKELEEKVIRTGLCTGCGACVGLCPYHASYEDRVVVLNRCDLKEGRCYSFCPRTPTNLEALRKDLFERGDLTPEIGAVRGFHIARASDPEIRGKAQHGGAVTALMGLALEKGFIEEAILTGKGEDLLPEGASVNDPGGVFRLSKTRFVVSPVLGLFNRMGTEGRRKTGIVATPCQTLALAKMRVQSMEGNGGTNARLGLIVGLFCGWAFSWEKLRAILHKKAEIANIDGMDVPPSQYHTLEVYTSSGTIDVSLDEIVPCVRDACWNCFDMTAEFSDISVGSARLPEGWEEARHWNQIIVRSRTGEALMALAKAEGTLEFRDVPEGNLERLKQAALKKKRTAVRNLVGKSGRSDDLLYLDRRDPAFEDL